MTTEKLDAVTQSLAEHVGELRAEVARLTERNGVLEASLQDCIRFLRDGITQETKEACVAQARAQHCARGNKKIPPRL